MALGPRLFRKQLLRYGTWNHPAAPGGKLAVTPELVDRIVQNFKRRVRDDVPVPMGHDLDALNSAGHVVGLEKSEDGLWGVIEVKDDELGEKVEKGTITGGSALIAMNHRDEETGQEHGPVLVHWALTNAPYIKGLAGYEKVALGETEDESVVIALSQNKEDGMDPLKELLEKMKEMSDEDIRKGLMEARPDLFKTDGTPDEEAIAKAKEEGASEKEAELVAALSEKGITVKLSEEGGTGKETEVDLSDHPVLVALAEEVKSLRTENQKKDAEVLIDGAIKEGKVLPAQREGMMEIALSEGGLEKVQKLIPESKIVDTSERGVTVSEEPGVELSEEDADREVERLVSTYGGKKSES